MLHCKFQKNLVLNLEKTMQISKNTTKFKNHVKRYQNTCVSVPSNPGEESASWGFMRVIMKPHEASWGPPLNYQKFSGDIGFFTVFSFCWGAKRPRNDLELGFWKVLHSFCNFGRFSECLTFNVTDVHIVTDVTHWHLWRMSPPQHGCPGIATNLGGLRA